MPTVRHARAPAAHSKTFPDGYTHRLQIGGIWAIGLKRLQPFEEDIIDFDRQLTAAVKASRAKID